MSKPSNLYAEKIFSEHPLDLWDLNDNVGYLSLISEDLRDLTSWEPGISELVSAESNLLEVPFPDSASTSIVGPRPGESGYETVTLVSDEIINFQELNDYLSTISLGAYVYVPSPYVSTVGIGYEYFDVVTGNNVQVVKNFSMSAYDTWIFISETFDIPNGQNTTLRLLVTYTYSDGGDSHDHKIIVNGLTFGQWSEEYQSSSLGITGVDLDTSIPLSGYQSSPAQPYGLSENTGHYLIKNNRLLASNAGIPMVFGSSSVTSINADPEGGPSIIFPGRGFLNDLGKYRDMSIEFWMRLDPDFDGKNRIFGPISSTDGIYVDGSFIIIKIGAESSSYDVGEWGRPMLIDFRVMSTTASLLINGELVISMQIVKDSLTFPANVNESGKNQDWLGFYSSESFSTFEIEAFAIYSYQVPAIIAKRRFVYGQGVEFPENINTSYSGTSMFIDYRFANYANNYSYPKIGKWKQGALDNFSIQDNTLSTPEYSLPELSFSSKSEETWISDIQEVQDSDPFISLKPNSEWDEESAGIFFESLNFVDGGTRALYVIAKLTEDITSEQTLIFIYDKTNSNYLRVYVDQSGIKYSTSYDGTTSVFHSESLPDVGEKFSVGLDLRSLSRYYGESLSSILGKRPMLSAVFGSDSNLQNTFAGNIYEIAFTNSRTFQEISSEFSERGVVLNPLETNKLEVNFPTYGLKMRSSFDRHYLAIRSNSLWQDYIPLSYFGKRVRDSRGNSKDALDFIQFNVSYPAPSKYRVDETVSDSWSYAELYNEYSVPIQREYSSLDNQLFTGYSDYLDLQYNSSKRYTYDTSSSLVKTYIAFAYVGENSKTSLSSYESTEEVPKNGMIKPGNNWLTTKYEVVDNVIIYPPPGVSFRDLAIITYISSDNPSISEYPIKIRTLEYASQALNDSGYNPIGTRFGVPIYPFKQSGIYYDFKSENPFTIYKQSSPYLYLNSKSGISPRGNYDPLVSRGLMTPMNEGSSPDYKVIAFQTALRYDQDFFPYAETQIFQIEAKDRVIKIFMKAIHPNGKRAKIYAINGRTGRLENGISFFLNGNVVREPVIGIKQWAMLGLGFANVIDVSNSVGLIKITGPIMVNNISFYQYTNLQEVQQISSRPWANVKRSGLTNFDWQFWNSFYMWQGVLITATTSFYGIDPGEIYQRYTGTNKIIVDDGVASQIGSYQYNVLSGVKWSSDVVTPV